MQATEILLKEAQEAQEVKEQELQTKVQELQTAQTALDEANNRIASCQAQVKSLNRCCYDRDKIIQAWCP